LFRKIHLKCRSSKHCKKAIFFLKTELNLDPATNPESDMEKITDPDPYLQIIWDPAGSGCTILLLMSESAAAEILLTGIHGILL
jgi:hypothetical protein